MQCGEGNTYCFKCFSVFLIGSSIPLPPCVSLLTKLHPLPSRVSLHTKLHPPPFTCVHFPIQQSLFRLTCLASVNMSVTSFTLKNPFPNQCPSIHPVHYQPPSLLCRLWNEYRQGDHVRQRCHVRHQLQSQEQTHCHRPAHQGT